MTLIITVATADKVVQASDRRLTDSLTGAVVDDTANKMITMRCADAIVSISYTGVAFIGGKRTDLWLVENLSEIRAGEMRLEDVCREIQKFAGKSISRMSFAPLTIVAAGFLCNQAPIIIEISNVEKSVGQPPGKPSSTFFVHFGLMKAGIRKKRAKYMLINGMDSAVSDEVNRRIRRMGNKYFFQNSTLDQVANTLVAIIRQAADDKSYGKYIGKNCMTIAMSSDPRAETQCIYHPVDKNSVGFAPHIIDPICSIKGIEFVGLTETELRFLPHGND